MAWRRFRKKKDMPSGLWVKCPSCEATLFKKELVRNYHVCGECEHHFSVSARERVTLTVDRDSFRELSPDLYTIDRLNFVDKESYSDKIARSMEKSGAAEAAIYGTCTLQGQPTVLSVLDFSFIGGSMGAVVGEKVTRAVELATEQNHPVIVISASGGARMHEGALSLMQMGKTSAAIARHHAAGGLFISVLTNPTTGGVMASFAALGDIVLAEPNALIGFAGPRVIKETLRTQLPDGFQRSEFLLEHGFLDRIVPRPELRPTLARMISLLWRYPDGQVLAPGTWSDPDLAPDDETPAGDEAPEKEPSEAASP